MKFLMMKNRLLLLIIIVFLITRLIKISEIPLSVYWDEASIGYNAYSILKTGKDEWGEFLPIHFRAFGEFKLPVYIYSVVPFVGIFGLGEFAVRFPAVLFSLGVVILTYLLAKKLSGSEITALFGVFFITVSPWFFIFSRTGYEATAGLMFYLLAILLFLQKPVGKYFLLSVLSFIISAYSYNSFRIIVPLTVLILAFLERDNIVYLFQKSLHWIVLSLIILVLSIWPIYRLYVYDAGISRFQSVGFESADNFFKNYASHFGLDFLFAGDKNLRSQQAGFGQIFLPDFVLLSLGLLYIIGSKSTYKLLPLALVLVGLLPSALTKEAPHALRAISLVPFLSIISAYGVIFLKKFFPRKFIVELAVSVVFLVFFVNYFFHFITIYPYQSAKDWQYGYKKLFTDSKFEFENSDHVLVPDKDGQPYIFALFYLKYDPEKFRSEVIRNPVGNWGFSTVKSFGKFEFGE
ncbi:glycosyltransferase family 39 protein [Candidatus Daviesbacteria bacterium]|nr:glycosyltransferase family 39 protein [Candidatus Daviesbacteria bacterium]